MDAEVDKPTFSDASRQCQHVLPSSGRRDLIVTFSVTGSLDQYSKNASLAGARYGIEP